MIRHKFERYDAYKDSGIEWFGDMPEHWGIAKLSQSFSQIGSGMTPKSGIDTYYEDGTINWINTGDLNDGVLFSCKRKITEKALEDYTLNVYPAGSIIIAMYGATIGKVSILMIEGCTNQACCVLNGSKVIDIRFLLYWFISKREFIISLSYGGGQPNISQDTIKGLRVILPTISEQKTIADYLDTKIAQIDRKIELLTQNSTQYSNLKQSLINETVIRGLDKTVEMKDSGVEWLGGIPLTWSLNRHKDNFTLITDRCVNSSLKKVGLENIEGKTGKFISIETEFEGNGVAFKEDDILFGKLRPYLAKVYLAEFDGNAVGDIFVYRPKRSMFPKFSQYLMLSNTYINVINSSTAGAKMPRVSSSFIANLPIPTPPLLEQKAIADYLDTKTAYIDGIIETIDIQIEKLKELRKTLINDTVTGKIKVVTEGELYERTSLAR